MISEFKFSATVAQVKVTTSSQGREFRDLILAIEQINSTPMLIETRCFRDAPFIEQFNDAAQGDAVSGRGILRQRHWKFTTRDTSEEKTASRDFIDLLDFVIDKKADNDKTCPF